MVNVKSALKILGQIIGIGSTIEFAIPTFLNEAVYRRAVWFQEPNVGIAVFELVLSLVGAVLGAWAIYSAIPTRKMVPRRQLTIQDRLALLGRA